MYKSNFSNISSTEISLSRCDREKFPYQKDYFDQFLLNDNLCPVMDGRKIEGGYLSKYLIFFSVKFYLCINDPITGKSVDGDGITCKSHEEISENLVKIQL